MTPKMIDISMVRGDTVHIGVTLTGIEDAPEEIYFSAKKSVTDTGYAFQKSLGDGIEVDTEAESGMAYVVTIESSDTDSLASGTYVYDIEVTIDGGDIITPVSGKLNILPDVTRH